MDPITLGIAAGTGLLTLWSLFDKGEEVTIRPGLITDVKTTSQAKTFGIKSVKSGGTKKSTLITPMDVDELSVKRTGALPGQAIAAQSAKWNTANNKIFARGQWFDMNGESKGSRAKRELLRFYANPPGAIRVVSKNVTFNQAWRARCPKADYPKFGPKDRSCRLSVLKPITGPKAQFRSFGKGMKDWFSVEAMQKRLEAAGAVVGAIFSQGKTFVAKDAKQRGKVTTALKNDWRLVKNSLKKLKDRKRAAAAIVESFGNEYRTQLGAANPHLITGGRVLISKRFMANPKTYEDLFKPGNSWPLIYNPPQNIDQKNWPNR